MAKGSTKHISWPVMWMIIATIPLANAFQAEDAGIIKTIMGFLTPLLGNMNPILFAVCCMILVGFTTQVVHNIILAIVFIPIFCNMAIGMGGNPYLVYIFMFWALNLSFMTPAASMTAVIMHGNEECDVKYAYLYGFTILIVGMIVTVLNTMGTIRGMYSLPTRCSRWSMLPILSRGYCLQRLLHECYQIAN